MKSPCITQNRSEICPQSSLGVSPSRVCGGCYFGFPCHAHRLEILEPKDKTKSTHRGNHPQVIHRSSHCHYTLVCPLWFFCLFKTVKNADIVVVGGRNNRDLVTLQKKYLRGIHFIQQAAQLHCVKRWGGWVSLMGFHSKFP